MKKIFNCFLVGLIFCFGVTSCASVPVMNKKQECEAHYILGLSYLKENVPTLALKEFLIAESIDSSRLDIQEALGQTYQLKEAYPEAEKHYLLALKIDPDDPRVANNLGSLYLDTQEWDKAIESFKVAAANLLFNTPEVALTGIGYAYYQKKDSENAKLYYQKALKKKRTYAQAYFRLGELYQDEGDEGLAKKNLLKTVNLSPNFVQAHYHLGLLYMKAKDVIMARESFKKVVELVPNTELGEQAGDLLKVLPDCE